jgi:hypothetical protein
MILEQNPKTGYFTNCGPYKLVAVHSPVACMERFCAIHNRPSNHPLRDAPLNWRDDRGILERICSHGVGHPDWDSAVYLRSIGQDYENVHGCDGCCTEL